MGKQVFYNGILYQIEYQPQLSNRDYTQHRVYHIKTEDEDYCHARKAIASIMEYKLNYKQGPSMVNTFHVCFKFSYNTELDVYVYTFIGPYND